MQNFIQQAEIILYVDDQEVSSRFYENILHKKPELEVPGMTEFVLSVSCKLGLMPNEGIARILQDKTPHPSIGKGIPRCELYLYVTDIQQEYENAIKNGAKLISSVMQRNWGDMVCYFADPDGHIIAFATK